MKHNASVGELDHVVGGRVVALWVRQQRARVAPGLTAVRRERRDTSTPSQVALVVSGHAVNDEKVAVLE